MSTSDTPQPSPRWRPLDARQRRVLGVLIEKAKTTPAGYPMTVNAIVAGCNQKNNRDPLMTLDDIDVSNTLGELQSLGVVSELDWLGRVPKYKHQAYEWLGVGKEESAVMTELLLRGAQALGELRGRAARMAPIVDMAALKPIVDGLIARGLVVELTPAGRGQIVSHNLYTEPERAALRAQYSGHPGRVDSPGAESTGRDPETERPGSGPMPSAPRPVQPPAKLASSADRIAELSAEVAELRAEVARLRQRVSDLEANVGSARG